MPLAEWLSQRLGLGKIPAPQLSEIDQSWINSLQPLPSNPLFPDTQVVFDLDDREKPLRDCLYASRALRTNLEVASLSRPEIARVLQIIQNFALNFGHEEGAGPLTIGDARRLVLDAANLSRRWGQNSDSMDFRIVVKLFG
jgi:hypothetical protein